MALHVLPGLSTPPASARFNACSGLQVAALVEKPNVFVLRILPDARSSWTPNDPSSTDRWSSEDEQHVVVPCLDYDAEVQAYGTIIGVDYLCTDQGDRLVAQQRGKRYTTQVREDPQASTQTLCHADPIIC